MLSDLQPQQLALAEFMASISERAYSAGWMDGLEYELWSAATGGSRKCGRIELSENDLADLGELSAACHGWITFDDEREETFVPLEQWVRLARAHSAG